MDIKDPYILQSTILLNSALIRVEWKFSPYPVALRWCTHIISPDSESTITFAEIAEIAKKYGDKIAFHGGIDTQQLLPYGTPQQVKDATKNCIDVLGANGRYIIAPSQEIMLDVPTENIMAMIEAIKEYR